jgi:pyruvate/2-oxoglutarate dehydrogenase complex dihydrolipoamide acyltransferase (E2) component
MKEDLTIEHIPESNEERMFRIKYNTWLITNTNRHQSGLRRQQEAAAKALQEQERQERERQEAERQQQLVQIRIDLALSAERQQHQQELAAKEKAIQHLTRVVKVQRKTIEKLTSKIEQLKKERAVTAVQVSE